MRSPVRDAGDQTVVEWQKVRPEFSPKRWCLVRAVLARICITTLGSCNRESNDSKNPASARSVRLQWQATALVAPHGSNDLHCGAKHLTRWPSFRQDIAEGTRWGRKA